MTDKTVLHPRDPFPALTVSLPGGRALRLPEDLAGHFGVVLFYRGSWCPYCNAQLSAFQRALDGLAEMDVTVVALSVDDEATTQELIAKHGLRFPVGYGADASAIADATGAFVNDDPLFLQSTGFVLDPGGRVVVSVYSSGAIGRLVPRDVIGLIRYLREQRLASRKHPPGRGCRPGPITAASSRATACLACGSAGSPPAMPPCGGGQRLKDHTTICGSELGPGGRVVISVYSSGTLGPGPVPAFARRGRQ
jgi:peroxiredoxin